jgi:hypothetical protein
MHSNLWQYIVVLLILAGIVVWILVNLFSKKRRKRMGNCCGCSLSEVCESRKLERRDATEGRNANAKRIPANL